MGRFTALPTITDDSALGGSTIVRSLRFNDGDSHKLTRTFGTNSSNTTKTFSCWVKRGQLGALQNIASTTVSGSIEGRLRINTDDTLQLEDRDASGGTSDGRRQTSAKLRDVLAWYHIVMALDSTQDTELDRAKFYINGEQVTAYDSTRDIAQNYSFSFLRSGVDNFIGCMSGSSEFFDGYLADIHFIDGAALDASHFGYTEPQTGIWRPKKFKKSNIPNSTTTTYSGTFTASGNGFGSLPPSLAFNGDLSNGFNNSAGGQIITWNTSTYNLSGNVRIYGRGSAYDVYINGNSTKVADMPSSNGWVDLGTHSNINEIQWAGTTYNTNNGLGSAGVHVNMIIVDGVVLRDTMSEFGTNGFHLDFSDNSSTTAATLGKDISGNGNNFTPSNYGASLVDDVLDTPTNNFCTLNPLERFTHNCTLSDGNLKATGSSEAYPGVAANIELTSGKWYYEFVINSKTSAPMCGVCRNNYVSGGAGRILYRAGGHYVMYDGSEPTDPDAYGVGDVIGVAIDLDDTAGNIRFYKNGTLQTVNSNLNSLKSHMSISTLGGLYPYIQMYTGDACTVNFGQRPFSHTPPSGHRKLTSNNILNHNTTSVLDPKKHFEALIYAGDDYNYRDITGLDFAPDFVWIKNRSQTDWHILSNSIVGMQNMLYSNTTTALNHALNSNGYINKPVRGENGQGGFSVNAQGSGNTNELNENYVAWCWKGGSPNIETPTSGSVFFAVDNNYLDLGSYTDFQFGTGDYTIEMWVYHIDLGGQQTYASDVNGNGAGVYFYKTTTNKLAMYYSGTIAESSSTDLDSNKWIHVAASRSSGTLKLFQDGIEVGSGSDSTNLTATQLNIGDSNGGSSGCMHGYISNVRILKGTGLYTSNFTPPTSPLTNITNTVFLGCQSETVAGLASVHPSPFSNNGTNYSSGSQMSGDILPQGGTYGAGGKDGLFDGRIGQYGSDTYVCATLSTDNQITWTPTSSISYSSKLEVWCYSPNGYGITMYYTLNGGSEQVMPVGGSAGFNNQTWITLATGSGTITSIKLRLTRPSTSFVNWGAVRVDGCILVNDVTGKVVTPTMDGTHSVPPSPKNPFDGEFAIDGTRYLTAAAAGLNGGTITPIAASINTKAGFSMLMYKGNGTNGASISHGLREAPKIFLVLHEVHVKYLLR